MDTVVLRGGPRQRGLDQGRALVDQIHALWERYRTGFYAALDEEEVRPVLRNMLRYLEARFPELLEELDGVAEGAALNFDAVARLNFGSAIGTTIGSVHAPAVACSNVGFADAPEGAIIGKNADLGPAQPSYYALKAVVPDRGSPYIGFGEVGGPWVEAAINAEGLAIGQASAPTQPGQDGFGMPVLHSLHLAMQYATDARTAVDFFGDIVHAGKGANFMIADAEANLVALERGHDRQALRQPENGHLYFANHFLTPLMQAAVLKSSIQQNSEGRVSRYREIFENEAPGHTIENLKRIIGDHGGPVSPCQHGDAGLHTRYAAVLVPRRRELQLFRGPACTAVAESYFI